jgi:hypothetical protein
MRSRGDAAVGPNKCSGPAQPVVVAAEVLTATAPHRLCTPTAVRPLPAALDKVARRCKPRAPAATSSARSAVLEVVVAAMLFSLGKRNCVGGRFNRCSIAHSDIWMRWRRVRRCIWGVPGETDTVAGEVFRRF